MRFTVLGSNATYPTGGRPASGYLIESPLGAVVLDAGPGTASVALARIGIEQLQAIVISHVHADHCSDVAAMYFRLRYGPEGERRIPLIAPPGVYEHLEDFLTYTEGGDGFRQTFADHTVDDADEVSLLDAMWSFGRTDHPVPCVATRIEGPSVLAYTSDTGTGVDLRSVTGHADVLVAEATFQGDDKLGTQHLTARDAGRLATASQAARLILTHIRPDLDPAVSAVEAGETFGGPIGIATPGMTIDF